MRLQRRLYRIYTVCFLIITIPFSFKTVSLAKSSKKPLKDYVQGRRLNLTMRWSNFNNFCSYLQSYILWATLYIFRDDLYSWGILLVELGLLKKKLIIIYENSISRGFTTRPKFFLLHFNSKILQDKLYLKCCLFVFSFVLKQFY